MPNLYSSLPKLLHIRAFLFSEIDMTQLYNKYTKLNDDPLLNLNNFTSDVLFHKFKMLN